MKNRSDHIIFSGWFYLGLLSLFFTSCSIPDQKSKPYKSIKEIKAAIFNATKENTSKLKKDRKTSRIVASLISPIKNQKNPVEFEWVGRDSVNPNDFDYVIRSSAVIRKNWNSNWNESKGKGTPLVFLKKNEDDRFLMKAGEVMPVTAHIEKNETEFKIKLFDTLDPKNSSKKIAKDFTAPINYLTRRAKLIPKITAIIKTNQYIDGIGLHRMNPFDPNKIPVILIHGFKSNPSTWVNLINQLQSDPKIRNRFQFWTFSYPTGIPILYSTMRLRNELNSMRDFYDPKGNNKNLNNMVLVGHSMGGIIARLLSSTSNKTFKDWLPSGSTISGMTPKSTDLAKKMFHFNSQDFITRSIFIATPHRGTQLASSGIARMLSSAIQIPFEIQETFINSLSLNPDISFNDQQFISRMKSINNLRPESEFIRFMHSAPIDPRIKTHSIIGIGKLAWWKKLESRSDFVVSYESAQLINSDSELTVAAWHDLNTDSETISEVGRILKTHY